MHRIHSSGRTLLRKGDNSSMRIALMTREYPPHVYGGAGVHVEYLSKELAKLAEVSVYCWGRAAIAGATNPAVFGQQRLV